MKLLLDSCLWGGAGDELIEAGHDVEWVGDWSEDPGDDEILAYAHHEERIVVTIDKDFGELAVVRKLPHSGIVRLVNLSAKQQGTVCLHVLNKYANELVAGAIVTAEPGWVRVRPADK